MKYDAVVFDLYGTSVPALKHAEYQKCLSQMAHTLQVDADAFNAAWLEKDFVVKRSVGALPNLEACIEDACQRAGVNPSESAVRQATEIRLNSVRTWLVPRNETVPTLEALRKMGMKLGLISNCSTGLEVVWPTLSWPSHFDHALLSCSVRLKKPDPAMYRLACDKLSVPPERCLYVGDGADNELAGAAAVGMHPVLIVSPDDPQDEHFSFSRKETATWQGPRIAYLSEVLAFIP